MLNSYDRSSNNYHNTNNNHHSDNHHNADNHYNSNDNHNTYYHYNNDDNYKTNNYHNTNNDNHHNKNDYGCTFRLPRNRTISLPRKLYLILRLLRRQLHRCCKFSFQINIVHKLITIYISIYRAAQLDRHSIRIHSSVRTQLMYPVVPITWTNFIGYLPLIQTEINHHTD